MQETLDQEMLENIELLLAIPALEEDEADWENIDQSEDEALLNEDENPQTSR